MGEALQRFVGKECLITVAAVSGTNIVGVVKAVEGNWLTIRTKNKTMDQINIDYVLRIREHPKNKKGKNKAVVY